MFRFAFRKHWNATRDPAVLFGPQAMLLVVAGLVFIATPHFRNWGHAPWAVALGTSLLFVASAAVHYWDSRRRGTPSEIGFSRLRVESFELIGTNADLVRVQQSSGRIALPCSFRCWLKPEDTFALYLSLLGLGPVLMLLLDVPAPDVSTVCLVALALVAVSAIGVYDRFVISDGRLLVEHVQLWRAADAAAIELANAGIVCDFAQGYVIIKTQSGARAIPLGGMAAPHAFVGSLIAAVRAPAA